MKKTFLIILLLLTPFSVHAFNIFAIVGDSHVGAKNSVYREVIEQLDRQGISTIIHVGDAIDRPGSVTQWTRFLEITGSGKTLYLAPGNHDISGPQSLKAYHRFFPKLYFSVDDGDTQFIFLNTEIPGEEGMISGEQLSWLSSELEKPFRNKIVILHQPLYPVIRLHGLDEHPQSRDMLHQLFVRKGVSLVFSGHDHIYHRDIKDGVLYIIVPQMGGWLPPSLLTNGSSFGYIVAERKDRTYRFHVLDVEGNNKDSFPLPYKNTSRGMSK
jgi:3',5'-cyclic AMP phosphodiesterase CpdA